MTPPIDDVPCIEFVEVITDYLDGALPTDDARRLEEHRGVEHGEITGSQRAAAGRALAGDADER